MRADTSFRNAWRLAPTLALGLGSLLSVTSLVRGAEVADLVQSYGLLPVDPPRPAADFSLPRSGGGEASLSAFQGQWVVLTFWASWCGPCRAEMPSLEQLHRSRSEAGVAVVGVSVDRDRAAADAFAEGLGLTFPLLWDQHGQVGRLYQANAIPLSYLVDPDGRIVAAARGARDWVKLAPMMDAIAEMTPAVQGEAVYADAVELPTVLDPPTAEIELSNTAPTVGEEFFLDIRLRWAGQLEEYLPQPPRVHLPAGMVQQGVTASTSSLEGAQVVLYRVTLRAEETGSYALDPVELRYQPRFASSDAASRIPGPTVEVQPQTIAGFRPATLAWGAGGLLTVVVAGLAFGRRLRSARGRESTDEEPPFERLMDRFHQARALRLRGEGAESALEMLALLRELRVSEESDEENLKELEEGLRYGGRVPPAEELDRLQRVVARRLEATRPDPDSAARRALRLHQPRSRNDPAVEENQ